MSPRHGVGGRLLLAFVGISAFALLAAAAALYSFAQVGSVLNQITQRNVPSALAFLDLSRQSQRVVTAAPPLLAVTDRAQYETVARSVRDEGTRLETLLADLKARGVEAPAFAEIDPVVVGLLANLDALNRLVEQHLQANDDKEKLLRRLSTTHIAVQRLLAPGILVMDSNVSQWQKMADLDDAPRQIVESRELAQSIAAYLPARRAQEQVSILYNTLLQVASAETEADLRLLSFPLRRALEKLQALASDFDVRLQARFQDVLRQLSGLIDGADSILAAQQAEMHRITEGEQLLAENSRFSAQLTEAVDQLVSRASGAIQEANSEALSVQRLSTLILAAVVALSLFSSLAIVGLYVRRNLTARLTALSDSMLAIARGNLETRIPAGGADEIGAMAQALQVFRDTAIEVRATNLREISEARRRLTDAIESISEGFSLYDAQDRLIASNSRYREVLYPEIADIVQPGVAFEAVVRAAAERGLVADAKGGCEQWMAQRLAKHNHPSGPFLQQQSDGRWIQIDERKIEDGGTVAIYTDITDLKQREKELADKSNALEQLSNQLAKYLSPQVYESIFSGRQEVKVASRRKKLSIFFSDITDFTQAADRLESEELSFLLNHYLTEMSRIALSFGATIDKYVGDAILIFFGDPETKGIKEDALLCVRMAIAMRQRMHALADIWRASGIEKPLRVRMGINTGFCTVGNFGSEDRMDYTIIGSAVNTASRLESAATPGEILISYETFALVREEIYCVEKGDITVKGIAYPVATYQVVDAYDTLQYQQRHFHEDHPNVKIDLRLSAMTADERIETADILRKALDLVEQ